MRKIGCDLSNFGVLNIPAPRVQVYCYIPRLNLGRLVDFMIDTGASSTCLNGIYALGLQNYMRKDTLKPSTGIGGKCGYYTENAELVFTDKKGQQIGFPLALGIQRIRRFLWIKPNLRIPCLLGRDILSKWEFRYNHQKADIILIIP